MERCVGNPADLTILCTLKITHAYSSLWWVLRCSVITKPSKISVCYVLLHSMQCCECLTLLQIHVKDVSKCYDFVYSSPNYTWILKIEQTRFRLTQVQAYTDRSNVFNSYNCFQFIVRVCQSRAIEWLIWSYILVHSSENESNTMPKVFVSFSIFIPSQINLIKLDLVLTAK